MKSFISYHESRGEEEEGERKRHHRAMSIEKGRHEQGIRTSTEKGGHEAENIRHKAARRSERLRHVRHHGSKYKHSGKSSTRHEDYDHELDETQAGSRQSPVGSGTHSSELKYITTSKRKGWSDRGRSSKKEKKRASKERRRANKTYDEELEEARVTVPPHRVTIVGYPMVSMLRKADKDLGNLDKEVGKVVGALIKLIGQPRNPIIGDVLEHLRKVNVSLTKARISVQNQIKVSKSQKG